MCVTLKGAECGSFRGYFMICSSSIGLISETFLGPFLVIAMLRARKDLTQVEPSFLLSV